jgi:transposase
MDDELFDDVNRLGEAVADVDGEVRLETANRTQVELTPTDLETLLAPGHAARLVWRFVEGLDLQRFHATIRAREGRAGRPAIDPKILVALWLYATIDGVGSARELDRLCYAHDAYRWLRGGVSVNYHTLSTFRVAHQAALDDLLTQSITVLLDKQVVTLNRITQDGTKIRASAGVRSFRRDERLRAAQARAAEERLARVDEALAQLPEVAAAKHRNGTKSAARTSTTDPDARVMKMMDGGYRPAYNVQFATDVEGQAVVGLQVTNGSDQAALVPMLTQVQARTGRTPKAWLADGGYVSTAGICGVADRHVALYAPVPEGTHAPGSGQSPPPPAVVAWRARMATDEGKTQYKVRSATAERIHADAKTHRAFRVLPVRGLPKVHTWALWTALAINVLRVMEIVPHQMT